MQKIPNFTELRSNKAGYDTRYEIDADHPLHNDPLVDPRELGFDFFGDASSYYSKLNNMTGEFLPGVPNAPLLRLDIVKRMVEAEKFLRTNREVREVLGAPAHLRIDDALRPYQVQKFAYEIAWPMIIRRENPQYVGKNGEDLPIPEEILKKRVAKPTDNLTPTPHLTGGAVDVKLINLETGEAFDRGYKGGSLKDTTYPDFHEGYHLVNGQSDIENTAEQAEVAPEGSEIVMSRRVLYYAMTNIAGLQVNPQEIWHYGKGDPLSEYVSGSNRPYYGIAKLPSWYVTEMDRLKIDKTGIS